MTAAGLDHNDTAIRLLAVAALTVAPILHGAWRRGGIVVNNFLAIVKTVTLLSIVGIGFALGAGASVGNGPVGKAAVKENFSMHNSFADARRNVPDYSCSLLFIVFSMSGFKQPFYVCRKTVRKNFRKLDLTMFTDAERGLCAEEEICQDSHRDCDFHGRLVCPSQYCICEHITCFEELY